VHRVLDVGAGVGKFVLAAAAVAPALEFVGIEQRADLVGLARRARDRLAVPNARFVLGDVTTRSWASFDAFYFFNPFAENLFAAEERIDERVELTPRRLVHDIGCVEAKLRAARLGSVVITYHGPTARIPASFDLEAWEPAGSDCLRLWTKRRVEDHGAFFAETDGGSAGVWHFPAAIGGLALARCDQSSTRTDVDQPSCGRRDIDRSAPEGTAKTSNPAGMTSGDPTTSAPARWLTKSGEPAA
jgi:hypothetical protein